MLTNAFIFAIFGLGPQELILILVVILLLFGARKIPDFARGLGQGIREFRNATNNVKEEIQKEIEKPAEADASKKA